MRGAAEAPSMAMSMSWTGTAGRSNCSRCGAARDNRRPGSARESRFPDRAKRASGIRRSRWPGGGRRGPTRLPIPCLRYPTIGTSIAGRPRSCRRKTGIVTVVPCCRKKPDSVASSQSVKSRSPTWSPSAPRDQPGTGPVLQDALVVPPVRLDEDRFPAEPLEIKRIAEVAPPPGATSTTTPLAGSLTFSASQRSSPYCEKKGPIVQSSLADAKE